MSVRSSIKSSSLRVVSACALLGACAHAPGAGVAQMSAKDMPELGETGPLRTAPSPVVMAKLDINTPVARLCANAKAKAVLDSDLPGLTTRPEFPFFKNMSLKTLKKMSHGQMTDADLAKVQAELAQIDPAPFALEK